MNSSSFQVACGPVGVQVLGEILQQVNSGLGGDLDLVQPDNLEEGRGRHRPLLAFVDVSEQVLQFILQPILLEFLLHQVALIAQAGHLLSALRPRLDGRGSRIIRLRAVGIQLVGAHVLAAF